MMSGLRICPKCRKPFLPQRKDKVCCSKSCSSLYSRSHAPRQVNKITHKTCTQCQILKPTDTDFYTRQNGSIYAKCKECMKVNHELKKGPFIKRQVYDSDFLIQLDQFVNRMKQQHLWATQLDVIELIYIHTVLRDGTPYGKTAEIKFCKMFETVARFWLKLKKEKQI